MSTIPRMIVLRVATQATPPSRSGDADASPSLRLGHLFLLVMSASMPARAPRPAVAAGMTHFAEV